MFRLIAFDLDGTLIDSRRDITEAANATLQACGAAPLDEDRISRMVGDGAAMLVARAFSAAGVEQPADALERFLVRYHERLLRHTRPYAGVPELLAQLGRRATLAVLTNKPLAATREILAGLGLASHFDPELVIGGDGPFARKPEPDGLRHLMNSVAAAPSATLLVGDSAVDWRTARAAQTAICLARYGFGFEGFPLDQLDPLGRREWIVDTPLAILERL